MTYASEVLADAPLAYWPLDEASGTIGDDSGNAQTLTPVNGPVQSATGGPFAGAGNILFDGVDDRLDAGLVLTLENDTTIEFWYKGTDTSGLLVSARGTNATYVGLSVFLGFAPIGGVSTGCISFGMSGDSTWHGVSEPTPINDDVWHHVVCVWNGTSGVAFNTSQLSIVIDGVFQTLTPLGTAGSKTAPLESNLPWTFGYSTTETGAGPLSGRLAQLAIYDTPLSLSRAQTHFTAGGGVLPTRPTADTGTLSHEVLGLAPIAYYRLGDTGPVAYDSSGNERDGSFSGTLTKGVTSITPSEPANTAIDVSAGRAWTPYAAWMDADYLSVFARIRPDSISGADTIVCHDNIGSTGEIGWRIRLNGGKLEALIQRAGGLTTLLGATTLTVGVNYSVGMTWDGTNVVLYLNGAVDATAAPGGGVLSKPAQGIHMGTLGNGSSEPYDGVIDEVAIWGSALTASNMSTLHAAAILAPGTSPYATEVMLDSPLAYYRLGEASGTTLTDSSGNARNGTYSGSVALATAGLIAADASTCVDFTGGHAVVSDAAWMQPTNLTVEAWVNADTITGDRPIVTHTSWSGVPGATSRGFHLAIIGSRVNVGMRFTDSTSHDAQVGPTLVTGTRYHMVLTWDGTTIRLFINGVIVWATVAFAGKTMGDPVTSLRIGASSLDGDGAFANFDGRIDEVALYGVALSPTRIAEHFTVGSAAASPYSPIALAVLDDKPLVYWKFDETSGTVAEDATGLSRTGTHFNGAAPGSTSLVPTDSGKAVDFLAGSSQSVFRSHEAWMSTAQGTVEGWFRADGAPGSTGVHTLAAKDDNAASFASRAWQLNLADATGIVTWMAFYSGSTRFIVDSPAAAMPRDATKHVVGTYDGVTARLYINGVQVASAAAAGALEASGYALQVGKESSGNTRGMTGQADEFALYGVALSAARILAHYSAGTTVPPTTPTGDYGSAFGVSDATATATVTAPAVVNGSGSAFGVSNATTSASIATVTSGEVTNREGGRWRQAIGYAEWMPAVTPVETNLVISKDVAYAYSTPVVDNETGNVAYVATKVETSRHRDRIVVGGKDITWWRGSATPLPGFALVEPLGYGPATLILPQVAAAFEQPGVGALKFLKAGARMTIQRVDDGGNIVATDYKGVIIGFSADGPNLTCTVGGEASGRAALREKQVPIFFWRKDLGRYAHDAIKGLRLPFDPYLGPTTDIDVMRFGGMGYLEFLQQLCAMGTTRTGKQWTIMPDWTTGKYEMFRKDLTTVRGTVYNDDTRTVASINRDIGEEPNRVYATGVTPEGLRVRFGRYPGLKQTPAPPYPYTDNRTFGQGTTDGMTDTGDGITILINRLYIVKYLGREEIPLGYGAKATRAIKDLQRDAGLTVTGNVNLKTWEALYDLTATGFSLRGSHIGPAAESRKVRVWNRSGSGAIMSRNPGYDRSVLPVDRNVDVGTGFERGQIKEWSETELEDSDLANWVGSITFNTNALVAGTHVPGNPLAAGDILRARDLRAGDNLWLPLCQGGITVHVSAVQVSAGTGEVSVDVDTRGRDALEVWEVITRNREARRSLRREWLRENRSSTQTKDSTAPWDEVGGILYDKVALTGGKWNVFPVVAGQEGTIQRLRVRTNPDAEFVMAVFGRRIYPARLRKLIGNPLTEAGSRKWLKESVKDSLDESNVLLYVAGSDKQPCGYFPKAKTGKNDENTAAAPLTGRWEDDSTFAYRCFPATVLWVAIWVDRDTSIPQGRIMWPQLEAGT